MADSTSDSSSYWEGHLDWEGEKILWEDRPAFSLDATHWQLLKLIIKLTVLLIVGIIGCVILTSYFALSMEPADYWKWIARIIGFSVIAGLVNIVIFVVNNSVVPWRTRYAISNRRAYISFEGPLLKHVSRCALPTEGITYDGKDPGIIAFYGSTTRSALDEYTGGVRRFVGVRDAAKVYALVQEAAKTRHHGALDDY
jgi:hypothetical protein